MFSHGLLFNGAMFEAQIAHFRKHHRCIAFDHRGQGQSGVTKGGYDIETLTADAAALIRHLEIAPCHFVGLSMGGFVGMRLAARNPDLLKTLTLLSTSADPEPVENGAKYRLLNLVARWIGLWAVVGRVMPIVFGQTFLTDATRATEKVRWAKAIAANDRIGITRAVSGVIERVGCGDLLELIRMPVGIGVGDEDVATEPRKSMPYMRRSRGRNWRSSMAQGIPHQSKLRGRSMI
ncbi:alpha/beta fold hydrolase [Puniceibacterium sediminis]|uniref:alpha/beta fold hydrolase n=1 Tax=Puniceibacterium sediminis TaxID=1608407 RepID=UPI002481B5DF|nr:alpha/beta hydrolase [Puniceibacterium sediminis]